MYTFRRFIGCVCTLGCLFCTLATTQLTAFATDIVPVTDTWIPLPDAWDTVAPFYDTYNNALSSDSGVTITADNYDEYVFRSVIGNWVATNSAFGEDVSLNGIIDVLEADTDYYNYLINQIQVNPINASYRFGESAGASLRAFLGDMLEDTFGLTDIVTTSEAYAVEFPEGRVFVKAETITGGDTTVSDPIIYVCDYGTWVYIAPNSTYRADGIDRYYTNNNDYPVWITCSSSDPTTIRMVTTSPSAIYVVYNPSGFVSNYSISTPYYDDNNNLLGYYVGGHSALSCLGSGSAQPVSYEDITVAVVDFFNNISNISDDITYSDPVVIINDEEPPIISPTSVYNDWSTISNYYYDSYTTDYVTYNTGDSIYNYTYYYSINNYSTDMPLWVVNGKNLPVYEFDRETFYDFSNTNYTVSDDLVWDSSFFDFVWEYLPEELTVLLITMLVAGAFFLLFKH